MGEKYGWNVLKNRGAGLSLHCLLRERTKAHGCTAQGEKNIMSNYKILVVDDDPDILKIVQDNLELDGYGVRTASFGKEALAYFEKEVFDLMPSSNFSFEVEVLPQLIENGQLSGYLTDHRYYSIGSIERLSRMEKFLLPKKIIFLDRDGVINKKAPKSEYIKSWDEFTFLPGSIEAMTLLTRHNYKIFIITNQAGIQRRIMTEQNLRDIHMDLERELEKHNIKIEGIYYCPHGWNEGCECRKPKSGMLFQAAREHDLDLSTSTFIGDDERDMQAGNAAGCRTLLVDAESSLLRVVKEKIIE
jgi:histidinol-phosphate phosphatase family protein